MKTVYMGLIDYAPKSSEYEEHPDGKRFVMYCDHTYSVDYEDTILRPISEITVSAHCDKTSCLSVKAVWDTGSMQSAISRRLARKLSLEPVETIKCVSPDGMNERPCYFVSAKIADILVQDLKVTEYPLEKHDVDFLIGMDIISRGKLVIENIDEKTRLAFELK